MPLEVDTVLHEHFGFWKTHNTRHRRSLAKLMDCCDKSVGRGAVLLLNSCPGPDGLIPEGDGRWTTPRVGLTLLASQPRPRDLAPRRPGGGRHLRSTIRDGDFARQTHGRLHSRRVRQV